MIAIILCLLSTWDHKTMILNVFILMFIIFKSARCSVVRDALDPESIHISNYCPKQKYCGEGAHVVCMYYDQNQKFGPRCVNPVDIEVTPKMIQNILANVNDIRGKVATGTEKGKDDEVLPRAYGLMKLEWDKELAFLAQVLANQCFSGREDSCRATDRFPNPSQNIAIVRYKYPNWEYLHPNNTDEGLNEGKLLFALDRFLKTTYALKKTVTKEIIMKCPHFQELPNGNLKYYLNLVRGGATHIGCGVSAFSRLKMDGDSESIQNNVQIVCNISDSPQPKQAVYKIVPPITGQGYSKRCGCPRGYKESRSCLCERDLKNQLKIGFKNHPEEDNEEQKKNRAHAENNDEEIDKNIIMALNGQSFLTTNDYLEKKDRQTNGVDSLSKTSKSHNAQNHPEKKDIQNFDSSEEFLKITNTKNKNIYSTFTNERHDPVIKFSSDMKSKSKDHKPILKSAATADVFQELISNVQSFGGKQTTEEAVDFINSYQHLEQNHDVDNKKSLNLKPQNNDSHSKHNRLLSILNSLEQEVNNIKFDNDLQQLFDSKMRKIYENGSKKAKKTLPPRPLNNLLDNKDLYEFRTYLENENNASVEDEIATLRNMIHHLSKGKHKDHKVNYGENDNIPNQNYNHMDQRIDEFQNKDDSYEDVRTKPALAEHRDYYIQFHDLLDNKNNYRQNNNYNDLHERSEAYNLKKIADHIAQHSILSKVIGHKLDRPEHRTSFDARLQFSQPFSRRNENDELHQMLLRRPNLLDTLRMSRKKKKPSIYQSQRDTFTY